MPQHLNRIQVRTLTRPTPKPFCPAAEPKCASAWGHELMTGHSPSGFFGKEQNSWFHQSQQVIQVLKQQSSPRPSHYYYHHIWLLVWWAFSEMPDVMGRTPSKKFNFCLVSPQIIFPKVLGIIKMFFFARSEMSLYVIFGQQWFLPWNSAMDTIFAQSLSFFLSFFLIYF